jgi:hypothetical protein
MVASQGRSRKGISILRDNDKRKESGAVLTVDLNKTCSEEGFRYGSNDKQMSNLRNPSGRGWEAGTSR